VWSRALSYANKVDRLDEFAKRFGDVVVETLDWADVFEKYDSEDTVFYCDPLCGYEDLPGTFEDVYVLDRDEKRFINSGKRGSAKDAKERLS